MTALPIPAADATPTPTPIPTPAEETTVPDPAMNPAIDPASDPAVAVDPALADELDHDLVQEQVLAFLRGRYPQVEIGAEQDIFALGFVNSLFAMELVMYVEKTFAVTVPNDELRIDNFRSARSMAGLVGRLTAGSAPVGG